ncbi:lipid II flippase Amj family protein [Janthinobacterium sp. AD80]|uniref:lipid II flippase Amj family protein n=1 Tax=Janthinobacterium sp. AD80 TaxID=1528773 RepID=UPI000C8659CB|nr:lipid II flippase Amj family protein [Janthinobacterium sp. AD80]PMQ17924.1 hypothetical protein JaAD80_03000 [Janthinobacterium sp. AD80]
MNKQLLQICALTFIIHIIGTLACSVRIASIRTRRIAVSLALFSILILLVRTSNSFLGPFFSPTFAKRMETGIDQHVAASILLVDFHWLLLSASLATVLGAILIPTFQRAFCRAVEHFQVDRSVPKLLLHAVFKGGLSYLKTSASLPKPENVTGLGEKSGVSVSMTAMNVIATALWTVGVFASLYAGVLDPSVRVTSSTLSSIINGGATIMMAVFIDPHLSGMTDDAIEGKIEESQFRRAVVWLVGSRLAGTLIAQFLLVPSAVVIVGVARLL